MARVIIILLVALLIYLAFLWFVRQTAKTRFQTSVILGGAVLIALAATGRLHVLFALLGALLPFLRRIISLLTFLPLFKRIYRQINSNQTAQEQPTGQQSIVETRYFRMTLDHDSGEMNGSVLEGQFAGMELKNLSAEQLTGLLAECIREDDESAQLLRAYLERVYGDKWQGQEQPQTDSKTTGFSDTMTSHEAYAILGLEEGSGKDEIIDAHRRLMQKLHPDHGGSNFLASKINQAKELLLENE